MSSLEALLSKLPSVVVPASSPPMPAYNGEAPPQYLMMNKPMELMGTEKVAKEEFEEDKQEKDAGESSSSMSSYHHHFGYHQDLNVTEAMQNHGYQ